MKPITFVTLREMSGDFVSQELINTRFTAFIVALGKRAEMSEERITKLLDISREILEEADIPQL